MKEYALFSLFEPYGCEVYAKKLIANGFGIIASSETSKYLDSKCVACQSLEDFLGIENSQIPPTLHPRIEQMICGGSPDSIEIVYDICYPRDKGFDVGGHTLLAFAIKGDKIPVSSNEDMQILTTQMEDGKTSDELKEKLTRDTLEKIILFYASFGKGLRTNCFPKQFDLLWGENPYQNPASVWGGKDFLWGLEQVAGEIPCYTNLCGIENIVKCMIKTAKAFELNTGIVPNICVCAKHGNPIGLSYDFESCEKALEKSIWADARSIWGGELAINFSIDAEVSGLIRSSEERGRLFGSANWNLDCIASPGIGYGVLEDLSKRKKTKVFTSTALARPELLGIFPSQRSMGSGLVSQPADDYIIDLANVEWVGEEPSKEKKADIILAWASAYTSFLGGNEVSLAKDGRLLSCGGGPSTVDAAMNAIRRSTELGSDPSGSVFAADAFFPFEDAPQSLIDAGVCAGIVAAGGRNHERISGLFQDQDVFIGFIPERYRGFCRH